MQTPHCRELLSVAAHPLAILGSRPTPGFQSPLNKQASELGQTSAAWTCHIKRQALFTPPSVYTPKDSFSLFVCHSTALQARAQVLILWDSCPLLDPRPGEQRLSFHSFLFELLGVQLWISRREMHHPSECSRPSGLDHCTRLLRPHRTVCHSSDLKAAILFPTGRSMEVALGCESIPAWSTPRQQFRID